MKNLKIQIIGPLASGKTTVAEKLQVFLLKEGYTVSLKDDNLIFTVGPKNGIKIEIETITTNRAAIYEDNDDSPISPLCIRT